MYLTREEEAMLRGDKGEAVAMAMEAIVRVGEILGAERLVPIKHAHVSGVSYGTIGEAGLAFIRSLAEKGARFTVPTTVNPIGFDSEDPENLAQIPGVSLDRNFIQGQLEILKALRSMGAETVLTCTPYYTPNVTGLGLRPGDSVAWGESSAIAYANSVLGLRTNREGGPLALLAAIAGRTYYWGLHIDENRKPRVLYKIEGQQVDDALAGVLGKEIAESTSLLPRIEAKFTSEMALREFLAALGTAGKIAMAHIDGITPEPYDPRIIEETVTLGPRELAVIREKYEPDFDPEIIFVGCPHSRAEDLSKLVTLLERGRAAGRAMRDKTIVVTMSRAEAAKARDILAKARSLGIRVVPDTCLIVSPFGRGQSKPSVATNSYKAYFYLSKRGVPVGIAPIERLVEYVFN